MKTSASANLVEITSASHGVELSIAYATSDNFTGRPVYARPGCYLHSDAAACLVRAIDLTAQVGLRLKIFDAFRPSEAQWKLWEHTPDPDFLADPRRGSPHSMGAAVDLTLIDTSGNDLDMGTGFDEFTPRSHHGTPQISSTAARHRAVLLGLMTAAGWDFFRNEWWHYQLFSPRSRYPVLSDTVLPVSMMTPA